MNRYPLYRAVADSIQSRIASGLYKPECKLPPEPVLEKEFGVSRITIRNALDLLKQKGLLYSRSGKGTIVRADALAPHSMKITGSIADLSVHAANTRYSPISSEWITADIFLAEKLQIQPGDEVLYLTGCRGNGDGVSFAFEEIYVPKAFSEGVNNIGLGLNTVFSQIETISGVSIAEVRQVMTAVMPGARLQKTLGIVENACCLRALRLYIARDNRPVELAIVHYDSTKFEFTTVIYAD